MSVKFWQNLSVLSVFLATACSDGGPDTEVGAKIGANRSAIVGGHTTFAGQYPWAVRLNRDDRLHCGASLVHPSWVVTAASCLDNLSPSRVSLVLGEYDVSNPVELGEQPRAVRRLIIHPGYTGPSAPNNDIALLELDRPARIDKWVQTIGLPPASVGAGKLTFVGWGEWRRLVLSDGGVGLFPTKMQEVRLGLQQPATCTTSSREICLVGANPFVAQGPCRRDEGGPAFRALGNLSDGRATLYGIFSRTDLSTCSGPAVFTDVAQYTDWIQQEVGQPLRGNVRMTWLGNPSEGEVNLTCSGSLSVVTGPINVRGIEISTSCGVGDVAVARCETSGRHRIDSLQRRINGGPWVTVPPGTNRRMTQADHRMANGDIVDFRCEITD